jgi:hypothetical protein
MYVFACRLEKVLGPTDWSKCRLAVSAQKKPYFLPRNTTNSASAPAPTPASSTVNGSNNSVSKEEGSPEAEDGKDSKEKGKLAQIGPLPQPQVLIYTRHYYSGAFGIIVVVVHTSINFVR